MKTFDVQITGTTPLLQHRFTETTEQDKATRKVLVANDTPRAQADKVAYRDAQGRFYFPGAAISRLIREAGGNHKLKGSRKSAKYVVPAAVLVREDAITLLNGDGKTPVTNFEVDSRPVTIADWIEVRIGREQGIKTQLEQDRDAVLHQIKRHGERTRRQISDVTGIPVLRVKSALSALEQDRVIALCGSGSNAAYRFKNGD